MVQQKRRRDRGFILTSKGWQKLEAAMHRPAMQESRLERYWFEALSECTLLDPRTVARIMDRVEGVDNGNNKTVGRQEQFLDLPYYLKWSERTPVTAARHETFNGRRGSLMGGTPKTAPAHESRPKNNVRRTTFEYKIVIQFRGLQVKALALVPEKYT